MPRRELIKNVRRIVVKIGTSSLTEGGKISGDKISRFVSDIAAVKKQGYQVIIVSSGAITAGAGQINKKRETLSIPEKQAMAAVGQVILINEYRKHFIKKGYNVGQILLTEDDVKHRRRFLNARHTMEALLELDVIPIVNENDTVVVKEIKFGDNDTLSAHVASLIDADLLVLLSDVDGFFWDLADAKPVEEIRKITPEILERAGGSGSADGTGGMMTKIRAAEMIIHFGEKMIIANGCEEKAVQRIMKGENIGTIFIGNEKRLSSRKKWVALRKARGTLVLDDGAVDALVNKKKSLLASGILTVDGTFDMGMAVDLADKNGAVVGKGIVNYNSGELDRIKGKNTRHIREILGSTYFEEVINRDDMIIF
ncbi:MAG: glutamate 5-kinase [Spirochaetae bacterium HGW-Spirochaetae-1]|jgi:glutamate 5-kinase|nr:MAG: glutamate 5-kinase [Spirochaetae bacterium HGW-Spirochaetae-1]